jgi:hypothetical protein
MQVQKARFYPLSIPLLCTSLMFAAAAALLPTQVQAKGQSADAIFNEVYKGCKHKSVTEIMIFVIAAPMGQTVATPEQEAKYIANEQNFANAQEKSPCWTRERWERYVHATLEEERVKEAKKK